MTAYKLELRNPATAKTVRFKIVRSVPHITPEGVHLCGSNREREFHANGRRTKGFLSSRLTRLYLNRIRQQHRTVHQLSDRYVLTMLQVTRQRPSFHPRKLPRVFNRNDRVRSRENVAERETSVHVALIPSESLRMCFRIFRHQRHH